MQLAALNPSIVGVQESRDESLQMRMGPFLDFSSASIKGVLGWQFLINADAEYLPSKKPFFFKHTSVVNSDPRLLMVVIDNGHQCATYIVSRAARNAAPTAVRRAWLAKLRQRVAKIGSDVTFVY